LLDNRFLPHNYTLPPDCQRFSSLQAHLQRRQSNREEQEHADTIAFQGMSPHETLEMIRAREHGLPHPAQIKRRMTNPHKPSESSWF
jgi:hypothetical protein